MSSLAKMMTEYKQAKQAMYDIKTEISDLQNEYKQAQQTAEHIENQLDMTNTTSTSNIAESVDKIKDGVSDLKNDVVQQVKQSDAIKNVNSTKMTDTTVVIMIVVSLCIVCGMLIKHVHSSSNFGQNMMLWGLVIYFILHSFLWIKDITAGPSCDHCKHKCCNGGNNDKEDYRRHIQKPYTNKSGILPAKFKSCKSCSGGRHVW